MMAAILNFSPFPITLHTSVVRVHRFPLMVTVCKSTGLNKNGAREGIFIVHFKTPNQDMALITQKNHKGYMRLLTLTLNH